MQNRGIPFHVADHGLYGLSSPKVPATVVRRVGVARPRSGTASISTDRETRIALLVAEPTARPSDPPQQDPKARRNTQAERQKSGDQEHVEVLDTEVEIDHSLCETTEEERTEEDGRRAVPKEQVDGGQNPNQNEDKETARGVGPRVAQAWPMDRRARGPRGCNSCPSRRTRPESSRP